MANRVDYYFRERVTEAELDLGFAELEQADRDLAADLGFTGILANAVVSQHAPVADLTVDVSGPGAILDQLGQRIFFSALQNVNVAQDENGVSTAVSAAGKEKLVSLFVKFDRALSDPRVDGNSLTVFFRRDESFKFVVAQGVEAQAGGAIPPPLRSDAILLADVTRGFGQTQILAADISIARRQDALIAQGSPRSLRRGRTLDALIDLLTFYNLHVGGTGDRHAATAVDFAGAAAWADGSQNPAATVEAQLEKTVADLASPTGAPKVGAAATSGSPNALTAGSVKSQLDALLSFINGHINSAGTAHPASAISYAGGGAWADGTTNPTTNVESQLDKLISDLGAMAGGGRVGYSAPAGETLAANTVKAALDRVATRGLRRNFIHNGNFCVWRRHGNYVSYDVTYAPTRVYVVDRWYLVSSNGTSGNGQVDLYPYVDGGSLEKSGLALCKYGTGMNEVSLMQEIERVDVQHLAGKTVGLSFRVGRPSYLPAGGTFKVLLIAGTGSTNQVLTSPYTGQTTVIDSGAVTVPLDSFQTFSFTGTVPTNATTLAVKISYTPTGNSSSENLYLQWLSLVIGAGATEFDYASGSRANEYDLCTFYYENSYENGGVAAPGYNNGRVGFGITLPSNGSSANTNFLVGVVRMRDKRNRPTIRLYTVDWSSNILGRLNTAPMGSSVNASFACSATGIGTNEFELYVPMGASPALDLNGNKTVYGEWDADADY